MIKASELAEFLESGSWPEFLSLHQAAMKKFFLPKKSNAISSILWVATDMQDFTVTMHDILLMQSDVHEGKISLEETYFIFNLIAAGRFDFDSNSVEHLVKLLSGPEALRSTDGKAGLLAEFFALG